MQSNAATRPIIYCCLVPATVLAGPLLVLGVLYWPVVVGAQLSSQGISLQVVRHFIDTGIRPGDHSISELIPITVPPAIWGFYSLWACAINSLKGRRLSATRRVILVSGLAAGMAAACQVSINIVSQPYRGGAWLLTPLFLGLVGGVYFLYLIIRADDIDR